MLPVLAALFICSQFMRSLAPNRTDVFFVQHRIVDMQQFSIQRLMISHAKPESRSAIQDGAPGRGKSSSRSSTLKSSNPRSARANQRSRHKVAISMEILSSRAISAWFSPSAAFKMIRARCAFCCPVVCRAASFSSTWRTGSLNSTFAGFRPGMRHLLSLLSSHSTHSRPDLRLGVLG